MKRIVSLMLCLLMLSLTLASCGSDKPAETIETSARAAVTLGMYVITEEDTAPEAAEAVENAIKTLIKSKYTTNLEIEFLTEDEYYSTVENKLKDMKKASQEAEEAAKADKETADADESAAVTTAETIVNEYGVTEIKYPDLGASQIDILMIADYDKYVEYAEAGHLYNLDNSIKDGSKKLNDYIYPLILNSAKIGGSYYAVPNNKPIGGESTYLVINKAYAEEYKLDMTRVSSIGDLKFFFKWIKENKEDVTPLAGYFEDINARYMNFDEENRSFNSEFSLVGDYNSSEAVIGEAVNLFANTAYKNEILTLAEMNYAGYFGSKNAENFAAAVRTGGIDDMIADAENYEIVVLKSEAKPAEVLCSSAFAVSAYTKDIDRAMEVITFLNTDEELRNLLQYGIEGINYEIDLETGALLRLNNSYMMDINKTGNLYMAYPEEGMPVNIWEMAKKQNLASYAYAVDSFGGFVIPEDTPAEIDPDTGATLTPEFKADLAAATALAKASKEVYKALKNAATYEDFKAVVDSVASEYAEVISAFLATDNSKTAYALYKAK
ncbi:MAG: hypothetical protein U0M06_10190 [Clostridia bacterium]|nr:hypothetical protein [Clostridia bacterium]